MSVLGRFPITDAVMLVGPTEAGDVAPLAGGSWDKVYGAVGHLMQDQPYYPLRKLVESFPTAEELSEIGLLALG